jgi:hypothetical protein
LARAEIHSLTVPVLRAEYLCWLYCQAAERYGRAEQLPIWLIRDGGVAPELVHHLMIQAEDLDALKQLKFYINQAAKEEDWGEFQQYRQKTREAQKKRRPVPQPEQESASLNDDDFQCNPAKIMSMKLNAR